MTTLLHYLGHNFWWPFLAVAAFFGAGVGIGVLLNRGRRP